jgi:hypothetical protein
MVRDQFDIDAARSTSDNPTTMPEMVVSGMLSSDAGAPQAYGGAVSSPCLYASDSPVASKWRKVLML